MQPFTFFISYRRQDTAPIALLLKYEIEKRLQFVRVIVDVEEFRPGDPFPERFGELIGAADAVLVLIGKNWMPRKGAPAGGKTDWVAHELECAQGKSAVLPVFVDAERNFDQFELPAQAKYVSGLNAESIDYANWPIMVGPLIERIAVKLGLQKRPDADEYPKPDAAKARTQPLAAAELAATLRFEDYEGWYVDNFGNADVRYLVKTFKFRDFNRAADFMRLVSDHCRVLDHHPEWRNVYNHVTVSLSTWDAKRQVTIYDLNLALFMNKAARAVAGPAQGAWMAPPEN